MLTAVWSEHVRTVLNSTLSQEFESEVSVQEIYAAIRIKTHWNNALYQLTSDCFELEHELVIAESPAGSALHLGGTSYWSIVTDIILLWLSFEWQDFSAVPGKKRSLGSSTSCWFEPFPVCNLNSCDLNGGVQSVPGLVNFIEVSKS